MATATSWPDRSTAAPRDRWRPDSCAPRSAVLVGQRDSRDEGAGGDRRVEHALVDVGEHQLRPAEHRERAVNGDVAPREVEEPLAALAVHGRSADVNAVVDHRDVELPARVAEVGTDQL